MSAWVYAVPVALFFLGAWGVVRSRHLVQMVNCLTVAQASAYVLLLEIGYRRGAQAPIFDHPDPPLPPAVDPVVQAMVVTGIVVGAVVAALLLSIAVQARKRFGSSDPDELIEVEG